MYLPLLMRAHLCIACVCKCALHIALVCKLRHVAHVLAYVCAFVYFCLQMLTYAVHVLTYVCAFVWRIFLLTNVDLRSARAHLCMRICVIHVFAYMCSIMIRIYCNT
jgi:hypothetical protein